MPSASAPRAPDRTRTRSRRRRRAAPAPPRRGRRCAPGSGPCTEEGIWISSMTCVRHPGAVGSLRDELPLPEPPDDLEDEERVPVGLHARSAVPSSRPAAPSGRRRCRSCARSFGAEPRQRPCVAWSSRVEVRRPVLRRRRARRPHEQDPVPGHRQRQRGEQRPPLLRREVEVLDQDDRRPLRRQRPRRVDEDRLEGVLRERLLALRRRLARGGGPRTPGRGSASRLR